MRWEKDLVRDIRVGGNLDDIDIDVLRKPNSAFDISVMPTWSVPRSDFSKANGLALTAHLAAMTREPMSILEIGVHRNQVDEESSTSIFFQNKNDDCVYLGVDKNDRSYLDDEEKNIHTVQCLSQEFDTVRSKMAEIGMETIDVLLIDGWHSINQLLYDWEYSDILSEDGMVVFHDTRLHPGPNLFVNALDTNIWHVVPDACADQPSDWGIGFAWRR
jgi:hypothetical protein